MKVGLNTKSGIQKLIHTRKYRKFAEAVYRDAKVAFACDLSYHPYLTTLFAVYIGEIENWSVSLCTYSIHELDYGLEHIYRTARSLYRCWLSCKEAFPSSLTREDWVVDAWNVACLRADSRPNLLRQDEEACSFFVTCSTASLEFPD
jgi:hypothetical protein